MIEETSPPPEWCEAERWVCEREHSRQHQTLPEELGQLHAQWVERWA